MSARNQADVVSCIAIMVTDTCSDSPMHVKSGMSRKAGATCRPGVLGHVRTGLPGAQRQGSGTAGHEGLRSLRPHCVPDHCQSRPCRDAHCTQQLGHSHVSPSHYQTAVSSHLAEIPVFITPPRVRPALMQSEGPIEHVLCIESVSKSCNGGHTCSYYPNLGRPWAASLKPSPDTPRGT